MNFVNQRFIADVITVIAIIFECVETMIRQFENTNTA